MRLLRLVENPNIKKYHNFRHKNRQSFSERKREFQKRIAGEMRILLNNHEKKSRNFTKSHGKKMRFLSKDYRKSRFFVKRSQENANFVKGSRGKKYKFFKES